jgi:two-component system LytT family response regulator
MSFRVLVVDDEPLAREVVVNLLRRDNEITGVTETGDPRPVPGIVATERPDILFLDIEMPGLSGIQLASRVISDARSDERAVEPVIVFVTAYSRYAVDAFEVQATDYLLKPFTDERFFHTLDRAKRRVRERRAGGVTQPAATLPASDYLQRLTMGCGPQAVSIGLSEVLWIEAEDYYVLVHTTQGRHLMRASMASLEERLDPRLFLRAHRGAIVNLRAVTGLEGEPPSLVLSSGARVPVSRSRRPIVEQAVRSHGVTREGVSGHDMS